MNRPALLYLVHRFPYPPDKGDRIRSFNLLKHLSRRADVHLACFADEDVSEAALAELGGYCERIAVVRLSAARWLRAVCSLARGRTASEGAFESPVMRAILRDWARQTRFSVSLASASSIAGYLRSSDLWDVPAVVDFVDVDSQKWLAYAAISQWPKSLLYDIEARRLRQLECELSVWARAVTLVSDSEARLHRGSCKVGSVQVIPNGVDLDYFHSRCTSTELSCVFVGALDYRPNIEAACWFCRRIWPRVHTLFPASQMFVVGRRPSRAVRRLSRVHGVEIVGPVADVRPYLGRAAVVVAPLKIARGVQNKILEALAMGKPVVSSREALAGLSAQPGIHLLAASTESEWITNIERLFEDESLREKLGSAGRLYVEEHHCWDQCLKPLTTALGLPSELFQGVPCESRC